MHQGHHRSLSSRGIFMLVAIAALAQSPSLHAADAERAQAGIIKVVNGDVQLQRRSGEPQLAAKVGDKLFAGDRVVTAANAATGITLRDDTLLSLGPKTSFVLEQYDFDATAGEGNVAVRVVKGTLRYVTGLIGKHAPERQQVMTPTATIGIRGTDFIVEVAGDE